MRLSNHLDRDQPCKPLLDFKNPIKIQSHAVVNEFYKQESLIVASLCQEKIEKMFDNTSTYKSRHINFIHRSYHLYTVDIGVHKVTESSILNLLVSNIPIHQSATGWIHLLSIPESRTKFPVNLIFILLPQLSDLIIQRRKLNKARLNTLRWNPGKKTSSNFTYVHLDFILGALHIRAWWLIGKRI
jgi:hypothetical protein